MGTGAGWSELRASGIRQCLIALVPKLLLGTPLGAKSISQAGVSAGGDYKQAERRSSPLTPPPCETESRSKWRAQMEFGHERVQTNLLLN